MKNILNKSAFYKSKAVMIAETSVGVKFGEANPFIQFKFAPRADAKAQGQWDDANCFWVTNYNELYNFVSGMNAVATGKLEKYEMKNPKKGVLVQIRASANTENGTEYITFGFYRGQDVKINISLLKNGEYGGFFAYFSNLLSNYNQVCAIALLRNDIYYDLFEKDKVNKDGAGGQGGQTRQQSTTRQQSNTKPQSSSGGGGYPDLNDTSFEDDAGPSFGSDVPF